MVKGVSKTVIEVNNTGSKLFEKIVFYVTPEFGNLNAKQLKKAAAAFSFNYSQCAKKSSLRKRYKLKKGVKLFLVGITAFIVLAAALFLLL